MRILYQLDILGVKYMKYSFIPLNVYIYVNKVLQFGQTKGMNKVSM